MRTRWNPIVIVFCLLAAVAFAEKRPALNQNLEIEAFTVQEGVEFPALYLSTMMDELVTHVTETGRFENVLRQGQAQPGGGTASAIRLSGVITEFNKGNRALRYAVGFGAGKTKVKAHVKFTDASGAIRLEKDVDGAVWIGLVGGESIGATRGLAKEVAKLAASKL